MPRHDDGAGDDRADDIDGALPGHGAEASHHGGDEPAGGEGPILEEVDGFYLERDGDGWRLTDYWSGVVRHYGLPDPEDDSAKRLIYNHDMLENAMADWGY